MKKVLVCDDDEAILDVIKIVLEGENYIVETVSSAKNIFEKIKKSSPDLILLDHMMPNLEAKKTISLLKKERNDMPIILVSAIDRLEKRAAKLQVADFLEKPFEMKDLLEKVKNTLKGIDI